MCTSVGTEPHILLTSPQPNDIYSQMDDRRDHQNLMIKSESQDFKRMGLSEPSSGSNRTSASAAAAQQYNPPMSNGGNNKSNNKIKVVNFEGPRSSSSSSLSSSNNKLEESAWTPRTSDSTSTVGEQHALLQQLHVTLNNKNSSESCNHSSNNGGVPSKKSSSSNGGGGTAPHHLLHYQQDDLDNGNNTDTTTYNNQKQQPQPLHEQLFTNLSNELTSLHSSTQQAIQMSYVEQEHVSNDNTVMQLRISYLKRKIGLARQELIAKGGVDGDELLRLSLVKEVDSDLNMTTDESDDDDDRNEKSKNTIEVTYESCKPSDNNNNNHNNYHRSSKLGSINSRKGLPSAAMGERRHSIGSHDGSDAAASATSSIFRITFGGADGMPSRWRAREMEREKSEALAKKKKKKKKAKEIINGVVVRGGVAVAGDNNDGGGSTPENSKEQQLITLKQLVNDRESEISFLEREMMNIDKEKSVLKNEISMLTSTMEQSHIRTINEKEKLIGVIDICQLDNRRLEKELLETSVSLDVMKMNIELLGNELREARNTFLEIQERKIREKSERRRSVQKRGDDGPTSSTNDESQLEDDKPQSNQTSVLRVARERKPGSARNTTALSNSGSSRVSMESVVTMMSALTSDFSDLVDVLEGIDFSPR